MDSFSRKIVIEERVSFARVNAIRSGKSGNSFNRLKLCGNCVYQLLLNLPAVYFAHTIYLCLYVTNTLSSLNNFE